jgi:hypothetical protein
MPSAPHLSEADPINMLLYMLVHMLHCNHICHVVEEAGRLSVQTYTH